MNSRTSATTWPDRLLRASYIVSTMPWMVRSGLSCFFTNSTVFRKLRQTFEREELALQRHQNGVRRRHRVDGQEIKRRRTVDQHISEFRLSGRARAERRQRSAQPEGAVARLTDFKFEPGEIERRWRKMQARHRGGDDRVAQHVSPTNTS